MVRKAGFDMVKSEQTGSLQRQKQEERVGPSHMEISQNCYLKVFRTLGKSKISETQPHGLPRIIAFVDPPPRRRSNGVLGIHPSSLSNCTFNRDDKLSVAC